MRAAPLLPAVFALCPSSAEAGNGRADADEAVADSSRRGRSSLVFVCAHGFAFSFFSLITHLVKDNVSEFIEIGPVF